MAGDMPGAGSLFAIPVRFDLHPGRHESFLRLVGQNAAESRRREPGCLRFDVLVPRPAAGTAVHLYEVYTDRAAFAAHLASAHYAAFSDATAAMVAGKEVQEFDCRHAEDAAPGPAD